MSDTATVPAHRRLRQRLVHGLLDSPGATSIILALLVGVVMIAVTGNSPVEAYTAMVQGAFSGSGLRNTIARSLPIITMGVALAIPFRAGIINLGGEGQMVVGGLAGTLVAIELDAPSFLVIPAALVTGALAGAVWAALSAYGQTWLQLPILITSLLLNYPARALTGYLVRFPFADPTVTSSSTVPVPPSGQIPKLPLFGGVSAFILAVLVIVAVVSIVNRRSVPGYETAMSGANSRFSRYGGVDVTGQTVTTMLFSGAIAGMTGTYLVTGETMRFLDGDLVASQFAWTGLLVTLLARHRPWTILAAGVFFAALQSGGLAMQRTTDIPWQLSQVLQAVVIVAIASGFVLRWRRDGGAPVDATGRVETERPTDDAPVGEL
ncbi:MAG: ABC transporter permease [Nitriliruptoraceae bacterium]|nr:ABC transporter permease [Nitriliruptoraceae bacterium]